MVFSLFYCCVGWGYTVAFKKFLEYIKYIILQFTLHHSPLTPLLPFLEQFQQVSFFYSVTDFPVTAAWSKIGWGWGAEGRQRGYLPAPWTALTAQLRVWGCGSVVSACLRLHGPGFHPHLGSL